jgi:hypothetical protein
MTTSGEDHQYIHIITPMSTRDVPDKPYHGYETPMLYFRTQDGVTWDVDGKVVPEMLGEEWNSGAYYADGTNWAVQGNTLACSFINMGSHAYVIKSLNNGETWNGIKFFDSPVLGEFTLDNYADTCYVPAQGCVALDNNGKIHIAFSVIETMNNETDGSITYFSGLKTSFLSYWNEDKDPISGAEEYVTNKLDHILYDEYFDEDNSTEDQLYVKSTVPVEPLIGYYTPTLDEHLFSINIDIIREWAVSSYGIVGTFAFPRMIFDEDNVLHLAYLGLLDGGSDGTHWFRHPYYTTRNTDGTWTQTEYLVNEVNYIDREFAYLTSAGIGNGQWYLMAQIDPYAGTHEPAGTTAPSDHDATTNKYVFFNVEISKIIPAIEDVDYTPLTMNVFPNPAEGQVTVDLQGRKGNITVYNMLGQTVYHVENVENEKQISLNNMTTGVYFVTVRSGNATATQKLIVK